MVSPPPEVLATIFLYLEPQDLDTVPLVCKTWRASAGEKLWKRHCVARFGTSQLAFVTGSESTWRSEYLTRLEILRRWTKQNLNTVSYNATLGTITDVFADLSGSRVIAFNRERGMGNLSDPRVGKIARDHFGVRLFMQQRIACIDGSRFAIICGSSDGSLITTVVVRSANVVLSYSTPQCRHSDAVTAVWTSKTHRPNGSSTTLAFMSGGRDGKVILLYGTRSDSFKEVQLSDRPIRFVRGSNSENCVAVDAAGAVFWLTSDGEVAATSPAMLGGLSADSELFISCGYVLIRNGANIFRITPEERVKFALPAGQAVLAWAVDQAITPGPKYMAAAAEDGLLYCWRVDHPILDGDVPLFWTRPSPLGSERQPRVTQLALNAVVLLVGGYNGHCIAMDAMCGTVLRQVSSKLSRQVLDFRRGDAAISQDRFPISHLEIDSDPCQPHAVLTVKEAVQYIDSGADSERIKPLRKTRRSAAHRVAAERQAATDIREEVDFNMEMIVLENEEHEHQTQLRDDYHMNDLTEEEQLAYAVLLSENPPAEAADDELAQALQLSLEAPATEPVEDIDEELRQALSRSLLEQ